MSENYQVTIIETSKKLTGKERVALKTGMNAISLDKATEVEEVVIHPDYYALLGVHNEKSKNEKDYETFIVVDKSGDVFATGSTSFIETFKAICEEMDVANAEADEAEEYAIIAFRQDSKNYSGKSFITCRIG